MENRRFDIRYVYDPQPFTPGSHESEIVFNVDAESSSKIQAGNENRFFLVRDIKDDEPVEERAVGMIADYFRIIGFSPENTAHILEV